MATELVIFFIDGLDQRFVTRCLKHSERFAELFAEGNIHRVDGTVHSLLCMGQIFCGRHFEVLEYEGYEQIPTCDRIINWDMLLSHCHARDLIWNRLNAMGYRVGLMEMLGIFLSPQLEGFSLTKHLVPLAIQGVYDRMLSHHPPGAGELYQRLKPKYRYPENIDAAVSSPAEIVDGPPDQLSESDLWWVMKACGYHDLIPLMDRNMRNSFLIAGEMTAAYEADVVFIHTGHFDKLLHFFYGWGAEERDLMFLLDRVVANLEQTLQPKDILIFSDHGMELGPAHWSGDFLNRAVHHEDSALVAGSGERVEAALATAPPTDLGSVYDLVLRTLDPEVELGLARPPSPRRRRPGSWRGSSPAGISC